MVPLEVMLPPLLIVKLHLPFVQDTVPPAPTSRVPLTLTKLEHAEPVQVTVPRINAVPASTISLFPDTLKLPV